MICMPLNALATLPIKKCGLAGRWSRVSPSETALERLVRGLRGFSENHCRIASPAHAEELTRGLSKPLLSPSKGMSASL